MKLYYDRLAQEVCAADSHDHGVAVGGDDENLVVFDGEASVKNDSIVVYNRNPMRTWKVSRDSAPNLDHLGLSKARLAKEAIAAWLRVADRATAYEIGEAHEEAIVEDRCASDADASLRRNLAFIGDRLRQVGEDHKVVTRYDQLSEGRFEDAPDVLQDAFLKGKAEARHGSRVNRVYSVIIGQFLLDCDLEFSSFEEAKTALGSNSPQGDFLRRVAYAALEVEASPAITWSDRGGAFDRLGKGRRFATDGGAYNVAIEHVKAEFLGPWTTVTPDSVVYAVEMGLVGAREARAYAAAQGVRSWQFGTSDVPDAFGRKQKAFGSGFGSPNRLEAARQWAWIAESYSRERTAFAEERGEEVRLAREGTFVCTKCRFSSVYHEEDWCGPCYENGVEPPDLT